MAPTGGRDSVKVNARRARARVSRNDGREEERERRQALLSEKETESVGSFLLLGTERDARRQAVTSERFFLFLFFFFFSSFRLSGTSGAENWNLNLMFLNLNCRHFHSEGVSTRKKRLSFS